jgi:hypothetical protein
MAMACSGPLLAQSVDREQAVKLASDLKAQLAAKPDDATMRTQLVLLHLLALDNPAEASQFLAEGLDPNLLKYVPAAAKPADSAPELACLQLGRWYRSMTGITYPWARWSVLTHAREYLARYLSLHTAADKDRSDVEREIKSIDDALTKLCADPATAPPRCHLPAGQWTEMIRYIDPSKDAQGNLGTSAWVQKNGALTGADATRDTPRLQLPLYLQGSYEIEMRFICGPPTPNGQVLLFLPAGTGYTTLRIGAKPAGLDKVSDKGPNDNPTLFGSVLTSNRTSVVVAQVSLNGDQATIVALWDGRSVVRWQGAQSDLTAWCGMKRELLGVGVYWGTATIVSVRVRPKPGCKAVALRMPPETPKK